jgi:uncharacterized RDD family membrane protein YckC
MNIDDHLISEAPAGYISREAQRKFTLLSGILGALCFLGMFIIPFAAMMIFMPYMILGGGFEFKQALVERGTYWNGRIWYPVKIEKASPRAQSSRLELWTLAPDTAAKPEKAMDCEFDNPWLMAGSDRLWIISSKGTGYLKEGKTAKIEELQPLGEISRPFFYKGLPAVVEERPGGQVIRVLVNHRWEEREAFKIYSENNREHVVSNLQVLPVAPRTYFFLGYGQTLYYREGVPPATESWDTWKPVCEGSSWAATVVEDEPVIVCAPSFGSSSGKMRALKLHNGKWEEYISRNSAHAWQLGVYPLQARGSFLILSCSFPGNIDATTVKGNVLASDVHYGEGPFPKGFFTFMYIPMAALLLMPFLLVMILSRLMEKYRMTRRVFGDLTVHFASLWRRALAYSIDCLIVGWPIIVGYAMLFMNMQRMVDPMGMFRAMAFIFIGFFVYLLGMVVYSFTEGRWGVTPGKWLMGIRVYGTDLKPCGFGRALLRNLVRMVDGFFHFLVGIMMVALSENWQRLGDLTARTIVVMEKRGYSD